MAPALGSRFALWATLFGLLKWLPPLDFGVSICAVALTAAALATKPGRAVGVTASMVLARRVIVAAAAVVVAAACLAPSRPIFTSAPRLGAALLAIAAAYASVVVNPLLMLLLIAPRARAFAMRLAALRVALLITTGLTAITTNSFTITLSCWSIGTLLAACLIYTQFRLRSDPEQRPVHLKETLNRFSRGSILWTASGALTASLDVPLVAAFNPDRVGQYSLALSLAFVITGLQAAICGSIPPAIAAIISKGGSPSAFIYRFGGQSNSIVAVVGVWIICAAYELSNHMSSIANPSDFRFLTLTLVAANFIRGLGVPVSFALTGSGEHVGVRSVPILESLSSVVASVALGWRFGATGVAGGTLVSAIASLIAQSTLSVNAAPRLGLSRGDLLRRTVAPASLPLLVPTIVGALYVIYR